MLYKVLAVFAFALPYDYILAYLLEYFNAHYTQIISSRSLFFVHIKQMILFFNKCLSFFDMKEVFSMEKSYKNNYRDTKYRQIAIAVKPKDYIIIDDYCKAHNISKAALIVRAVRYCIAQNIDLLSEQDGGNVSEDVGAAEDIGKD